MIPDELIIQQQRKERIGKIQIFSHGFRVIAKDDRVANVCKIVLRDWAVYGEKPVEDKNGRIVKQRVLQQTYGGYFPESKSAYFHKGQFKDFQTELLRYNLTPDDFVVENIPVYIPKKLKYGFEMQEDMVPFDYQVDATKFILEKVKEGDHESKLVAIPPGLGKTLTLCYLSTIVKERMVVGVLPKYYKKWLSDIQDNTKAVPKDIMPVDSTNRLRGLIDLCKTQGSKKLPPYIVITLSTMRSFIDSYEMDEQDCVEDYGCAPYELWELLDCGTFAIDEAHEHLNTVFKCAMYLHGPKFVALSGTMRTEDAFQERIQQTIFPAIKRYDHIKPKKYNDIEFISYRFHPDVVRKIKYQAFGRTDYSHAIFEQSIIKLPHVLRDYLDMCGDLIDYGYKSQYQEGDKCIIFVGIVEMANEFVTYLKRKYPDKNVVRYCKSDGDKYEDMMKGEIIVTTIQSGGTGIDVKKLTYLGFFSMVNSSKSNIQTFYRVREYKGRSTLVSMPFCAQNPKHLKYTQYRRELFKDMAKTMRTFNYNRTLGG